MGKPIIHNGNWNGSTKLYRNLFYTYRTNSPIKVIKNGKKTIITQFLLIENLVFFSEILLFIFKSSYGTLIWLFALSVIPITAAQRSRTESNLRRIWRSPHWRGRDCPRPSRLPSPTPPPCLRTFHILQHGYLPGYPIRNIPTGKSIPVQKNCSNKNKNCFNNSSRLQKVASTIAHGCQKLLQQ